MPWTFNLVKETGVNKNAGAFLMSDSKFQTAMPF